MELQAVMSRVRSEFNEMPGLRLTVKQAMRLWSMDAALCERVVEALVQSAFLRPTPGGAFVRSES